MFISATISKLSEILRTISISLVLADSLNKVILSSNKERSWVLVGRKLTDPF